MNCLLESSLDGNCRGGIVQDGVCLGGNDPEEGGEGEVGRGSLGTVKTLYWISVRTFLLSMVIISRLTKIYSKRIVYCLRLLI